MKKRIFAVILLMCITCFSGCSFFGDEYIPDDYKSCEEHIGEGFQDFTDYCKYYYDDNKDKWFEENASYEKVSDIDNIKGYFSTYARAIALYDEFSSYDFNTDIITEDDHVHIETKEGQSIGDTEYGKYDNFSVYLYDTESNTLYYIHMNI